LHFIEVKSVSRLSAATSVKAGVTTNNVTRGTDEYKPEDNMHPWKLKRLSLTIQTYLVSQKVPDDTEWQVDLFVVYLDLINKKAKVNAIKDIIL
jgi:Holliday junction resolvase-like predicted endonuclease